MILLIKSIETALKPNWSRNASAGPKATRLLSSSSSMLFRTASHSPSSPLKNGAGQEWYPVGPPAGRASTGAAMSMGRRPSEHQPELWVPTTDLPRSPGHAFYDTLNRLLAEAGFDR